MMSNAWINREVLYNHYIDCFNCLISLYAVIKLPIAECAYTGFNFLIALAYKLSITR